MTNGPFRDFTLPTDGWRRDGSTSTGKDMLYRSMRDVLVRRFASSERWEAYGTHFVLKESGVTSAELARVQHVDGSWHYYVFADRRDLLAAHGNTLVIEEG
jgi:hypothetical protein